MCGLHCSPLEVSLNLLKRDAPDSARVLYQLSVEGPWLHCTPSTHEHNAIPREVNKLMSPQHGHTSAGSEEGKSFIHIRVHTFVIR